jgi:hypothetical protein
MVNNCLTRHLGSGWPPKGRPILYWQQAGCVALTPLRLRGSACKIFFYFARAISASTSSRVFLPK